MLLFTESIITTDKSYRPNIRWACGQQLHLTNDGVGLWYVAILELASLLTVQTLCAS